MRKTPSFFIFSSFVLTLTLACSPRERGMFLRNLSMSISRSAINPPSDCEIAERNPTVTVTREDVLQLCCQTDDGIERDCCALIYLDVPQRVRECHCNCTARPPMKKLGKGNWETDETTGCVTPKHHSKARDILMRNCLKLRGKFEIFSFITTTNVFIT